MLIRWTSTLRVLTFSLILPALAAHAIEPGEMLKDTKLEARAREISQKLRCVVCQNQSIDDSNAPLAKDLRVLVRERLTAGDSDSQAIGFIVARYGNFVLLKPPLQINTLLLWLGPLLLAALATFGFSRWMKAQEAAASEAPQPFTAGEAARLEALLGSETVPARTTQDAAR